MTTELFIKVFFQTAQVTFLVFFMMTVVDAVNVWSRGKLSAVIKGGKPWRQYVISSMIGAAPGCEGAFTVASLYVHGIISFGALVGAMASVSGEGAYLMLAKFPKTAMILFIMLFLAGIVVGWITDLIVKKWNIKTSQDCRLQQLHPMEEGIGHYLKDHIWNHIIKRHLLKIFLWTFGAFILVEWISHYGYLEKLSSDYTLWLLFAGALVGLIPESGPNLIFITMFSSGVIPFSVLFTSTYVQDGHGMLPVLSFSLRDSIFLKGFNLFFGVLFGLALYQAGW